MSAEQAQQTATTIRRRGGAPKYKIPGFWRSCEIQWKLNSDLNLGYEVEHSDPAVRKREIAALRVWFYRQIKMGNIPEGLGRTPVRSGGRGGGYCQTWTDEQAWQIFADLPARLSQSPLAGQAPKSAQEE